MQLKQFGGWPIDPCERAVVTTLNSRSVCVLYCYVVAWESTRKEMVFKTFQVFKNYDATPH
jgi:hypothetical protein